MDWLKAKMSPEQGPSHERVFHNGIWAGVDEWTRNEKNAGGEWMLADQ